VNLRSDRHARTSPRGCWLGPNGDGARKGPRTATPRGQYGTRSTAGTYPRVHFWSGTWKPRIFARSTAVPDLSSPVVAYQPLPAGIVLACARPDRLFPSSQAKSRSGTAAVASRQADRKGHPWGCGTGCWKKPRPACNEPDTGRRCPARKGAHVQQVLRRKRAWENRFDEGRR
jgi:hypothetical protein